MNLPTLILTLLKNEGGPMTGYTLTKKVGTEMVHTWRMSHQQVYRDLEAMRKQGLLTKHIEPQEGKPDRGYFTITKRGLEQLEADAAKKVKYGAHRDGFMVQLMATIATNGSALDRLDENIRHCRDSLHELAILRQELMAAERDDFISMAAIDRREAILKADLEWSEQLFDTYAKRDNVA